MLSEETSLTLIYEAFYFSGKSPQNVKVRIFSKTLVLPDKNAYFTAFWITTQYTLCSFWCIKNINMFIQSLYTASWETPLPLE